MARWVDLDECILIELGDMNFYPVELLGDIYNDWPMQHRAHKVRAHSQGGGTHWVVCSNCEKPIDWQDTYCKHCGAKMDEEVNT